MASTLGTGSYRRRRNSRYKSLALLCILVLSLFYFLYETTATTNPTIAFSKAEEILAAADASDEKLEAAESFLLIAAENEKLKPWCLVELGKLAERRGDYAKAFDYYKQVPPNRSASLDATLASARLSLGNLLPADVQQLKVSGEQLLQLEKRLRGAFRADLLPELILLRAQAAEQANDVHSALELYRSVRKSAPVSKQAEAARAAYYRLLADADVKFGGESAAASMDEARLLLSEGLYTEALEQAQLARAATAENSASWFETYLLDESILRKMRRNEEADHILQRLGENAQQGVADQALLQIAKNGWNVNDHHRSLETIERLKSRFPKSSLLPEARYIEARVLEEMDVGADAKDIYSKLAESAPSSSDKIRALKRLAWLYLLKSDFLHAAEALEKLRVAALGQLTALKANTYASESLELASVPEAAAQRKLSEARDDFLHALFWEGYALGELDDSARKKLKIESTPAQLFAIISSESPMSYYAMRAAQRQGSRLALPSNDSEARCGAVTVRDVPEASLPKLSGSLLKFQKFDLDWQFANSYQPTTTTPMERYAEQNIRRAKNFITNGMSHEGLALCEETSRLLLQYPRDKYDKAGSQLASCRSAAERICFPLVAKSTFVETAAKSSLPPALLFGIARSESYFNPEAVSPVGALGIVQLMPPTAKQEGWKGKEEKELFDSSLNLALGARHLKGLIANFGHEHEFSIAAYNAGAAPVNRWRSRAGKIPIEMWVEQVSFPETQKYVKRVTLAEAVYEQLLLKSRPT